MNAYRNAFWTAPTRSAALRLLMIATLAATPLVSAAQHNRHAMVVDGVSAGTPAKEMMHDFNTESTPNQVSHLTVGHSMFVDTKHRLTRVYSTNPALLSSYTANPNEVVVTANKPGTSTFIVWDEAGDSQTFLITADIDVVGLQQALKQAFPKEEINVSSNEDRIILTGNVGKQVIADTAGKLAAVYAKDVVNSLVVNGALVKQVRLKVRFVEVDRAKAYQFGFNFFSTTNGVLAQTSTNQFPSQITTATQSGSAASSGTSVGGQTVNFTNPLNFLLYSSQYNIGASLQDLETKSVLQILAEPTITAMSGEKANFLAGGEFPFPVVANNGGLASVTVQFRPYGVKLEFTPTVNNDGTITLAVAPEVSALDYANAVTISGYTIPALSTRRADTSVTLRSGQSFALSGLLDKRTTDNLSRTPGIASVPILGLLFKSKSTNKSITELIVIVTPTLVDPMVDNGGDAITEPVQSMPMLEPKKFDDQMNRPITKQ